MIDIGINIRALITRAGNTGYQAIMMTMTQID